MSNRTCFIYNIPGAVPRDGQNHMIVHMICGYTTLTLPTFTKLVNEFHEKFPFINPNKCEVGNIFKSERYNGMTIITWNGLVDQAFLDNLPDNVYYRRDREMDYWW